MVMLARLVQHSKTEDLMLVTPLGIIILVRLVQPLKAPPSMLVTLFGMVMPVRLVQPSKALPPMLVTLLGMENKEPVFPAGYVCKAVLFLLYSTPPSELYVVLAASTFIAVRLVQSSKTLNQMFVTLPGMVMPVRPVQS
jgi:hypothetical protein